MSDEETTALAPADFWHRQLFDAKTQVKSVRRGIAESIPLTVARKVMLIDLDQVCRNIDAVLMALDHERRESE